MIAQLVFHLERGHTETQKVTDASNHPTQTSATADVEITRDKISNVLTSVD